MSRVNSTDLVAFMKELDRYKKSHLNYYLTLLTNRCYEFRVYDSGKLIGTVPIDAYTDQDELYNAIIKEFDRCESIYRSKLYKVLK